MYNVKVLNSETKEVMMEIANVADPLRAIKAHQFDCKSEHVITKIEPKKSLWQRLKNTVKRLCEKLNFR